MAENFWNNLNFTGAFANKKRKGFHSRLGFDTRYIKPPKAKELHESALSYSDAETLAKDIRLDKNERYFVIVNGTFYFGDFIEAFIVNRNFHIKKMTISTLSLNQNNADSLANLLNGGFVDELNLIVSDYFYAHERNKLIPYLYDQLDIDDKFQLAAAGTHCKMCIFETHSGGFVLIHGSANLRTSSNIEQIVIEENEELYKFNDEYQQRIVNHYKTINKDIPIQAQKTIRGKELWQVVAKAEDQVVHHHRGQAVVARQGLIPVTIQNSDSRD